MYACQEARVIHSLHKSETQFRLKQGQQRAGALTGRKSIIQNTDITVNGVEHQKSV